MTAHIAFGLGQLRRQAGIGTHMSSDGVKVSAALGDPANLQKRSARDGAHR